MKRVIAILFVLAFFAGTAVAGGDKNRGEKGKGNVNQHQVRNK